jgi:DNA-damage-inducible protein J
MAQSTISIRMDPTLKAEFDTVCRDLGMSMSTAVVMLAKKMTREKRLPFEVSADPFYSEANIRYLEGILRDIETGKAHFEEHELIEVE